MPASTAAWRAATAAKFGTFFVVDWARRISVSLTPEQMETYRRKFRHAEEFCWAFVGNDP